MSKPRPERSASESPIHKPDSKKSRQGRCSLVMIAGTLIVVLLIIDGIMLGFMGRNRSQPRQSTIPDLLGAETLVYGTIQPNLSDSATLQWLQWISPVLFRHPDTPRTSVNTLLDDLGVTLPDDIQPWIGAEVAFAIGGITDFTALRTLVSGIPDQELLQQTNIALLFASRDDSQAQAFLDRQRSHRTSVKGQQFTRTVQKAIDVYEQRNAEADDPRAAFALVDGYVVFANKASVITAIINRDNPVRVTLSSTARFQKWRTNMPQNALGAIYVDGRLISIPVLQALDESLPELPAETATQVRSQLENMQALEALGLSVVPVGTNMQLDMIAAINLAALNKTGQRLRESADTSVTPRRLEQISDNALALATFTISPFFREQFLAGFQALPGGAERIAALEMQYGINLERDILNWFVGDASLVVLPGEQLGDITFPATAYFALQPADRAAAETSMDKIAAAFAPVIGAVEQETTGTTSWQVIQEPSSGQLVAGYGFVGDDLVLAFGSKALTAASQGHLSPITADAQFQTVTRNLPEPNRGLLYFKTPGVMSALDLSGREDTPSETGQVGTPLHTVQSIGIAGEPGISAEGVLRTRVFLSMQDAQ